MADPVSIAVTVALNAASMALTASQKIEGPRLDTTTVTNSDYGAAGNYFYGTCKLGTWVLFSEPIREQKRKRKTKGGKYNEYTYYGTWAVAFAMHQVDAVLAVEFDDHLVYNATGVGPVSPFSVADAGSITQYMRIYLGTATQNPDPRILATVEAALGAGTCPAYRNVAYIVFEDLPLEKLGNRLPQVKVTATSNGSPVYPYANAPNPIGGMQNVIFSPDGSRVLYTFGNDFAMFDNAAQAVMTTGTFDSSVAVPAGGAFGIGTNGKIYQIGGDGQDIISYDADGLGVGSLVYDSGIALAFAMSRPYGVLGLDVVFGAPFLDADNFLVADGSTTATTSFGTGTSWHPHMIFADLAGDVWAVGSTASTIVVYCITDENGRMGDLIEVAAPSTPGGSAPTVSAFCNSAGNFVVDWSNAWYVLIDPNTGTILDTDNSATHATGLSQQIINTRPGAASFWAGNGTTSTEISASDFSVIRTYPITANFGAALSFAIYDPMNNALFGLNGGTGETQWDFLDRAGGAGVQLRDIVEDIANRCGVDPNDIDATDLDQDIVGYAWAQGDGKAIVEPLLEYYTSEVRPHDFGLEFRKRTGVSLGTIDVGDMGASQDGKGLRYTVTRTSETDLIRRVTVTFADPYIGRQPNTAVAQRNQVSTQSVREASLDMTTLVDEPVDARTAADNYLRRAWFGAEAYELSVTRAFSALEPGDIQDLDLDGLTKVARLEKLTFQADGVLACSFRRDGPTIATSSGQPGAPADGVPVPSVPVVGYTKGFVIDSPLWRDADDGIITYLVAGPYNPANPWPGAEFLESTDSGVNYDSTYDAVASTDEGTWGTTSGALADALTTVWDRSSTVSVYIQAGSLTSASELAVLNGANRAMIGDEIVGFATATLTAPNTYTLSNFLRGRRGTEQHTGSHVSGDRFVMQDERVRHVHGASDVGTTLYIKPTTAGSFNGAGFPQSQVYTGASAKPYSPAHLKATPSGGDKVITWTRRTRIGGEAVYGATPPLGETTEAYKVQILNAGGTVLRTYTPTSPSQNYNAADQSADGGLGVTARVMQVSSTVGDGFPSSVSL